MGDGDEQLPFALDAANTGGVEERLGSGRKRENRHGQNASRKGKEI